MMLDAAKEKIGPLPAWVWGVILGLVAVGYIWFTNSRKSTPDSIDGETATTAEPTGILDWGYSTSNTGPSAQTASAIVTSDEEGSNAVWLASGVAFLSASRYGPLEAQRALSAYLDGETLTPVQETMVNLAVGKYGLPPEGVTSVSTVETPTPASTLKDFGDERRNMIARYYRMLLGREPSLSDVNAWDSTGASLAQIRTGIVNSAEAKK